MKVDLDKLETSLAKQEQYERGLNYNFAHAERLEILNQIPALIAELRELRAGEARAVEALKEIAVFAKELRERSDVSAFVVIGHMIEGYLNKHAAGAAALRTGEGI